MTNVLTPRGWTSLLVIGVCAFAMFHASILLRYGLAEMRADANSAPSTLEPFVADASVGFLARAGLLGRSGEQGARRRATALRELITVTPLASNAWFDLARARLAEHASGAKIAEALVMSHVTGPNEGRLMAGRAVFGLPLWPLLSPDARKTVISDLVGGWGEIRDPDRQALRAALSVARDDTGESIRTALLLAGRRGAPALKALQLAAPHQ